MMMKKMTQIDDDFLVRLTMMIKIVTNKKKSRRNADVVWKSESQNQNLVHHSITWSNQQGHSDSEGEGLHQ